ncbi:MAG: DNA mismatch repair protein MutS, partial [Sphingobacteriia bacterium]
MAKAGNDTPLMQQHRAIKQKYPDAILLFRVGDFYETFGQDAILAAKVLGITLTKRNNGAAADSELAGFPYHALDNYLHKLVKAGYRVAVCDQLEDPKQVKGIVKRGVTEMLTPGLALNDKLLEQNKNNFLAAYFPLTHVRGAAQVGLAFLDASTGEMLLAQGSADYADQLLSRILPAEIILPKNEVKAFKERTGQAWYTYALDPWIFAEAYATEQLQKQFQTHSLKGFGVEHWPAATIAAGAILHYLKETEHPHLDHINRLQRLEEKAYLWMDRFTLRNLELFPSGREGAGETNLLQVMDLTLTPMGGRLLR